MEKIETTLELRNRFDYYRFFEEYSIPFLSAKEIDLIEYIYVKRNNFVHNVGQSNEKTETRLKKISKPIKEEILRTEAKRLRTEFGRMIISLQKRVLSVFAA